jgi:hypothetical protein
MTSSELTMTNFFVNNSSLVIQLLPLFASMLLLADFFLAVFHNLEISEIFLLILCVDAIATLNPSLLIVYTNFLDQFLTDLQSQ